MNTNLTIDQSQYLHSMTVSYHALDGYTADEVRDIRDGLVQMGLISNECGWLTITDEALRMLGTRQAKRILRAREASSI